MKRRRFFIGTVLLLVGGLIIVPSVAAASYKSHLHAALTSLEEKYRHNLHGLPQSANSTQAVSVLQPFERARMPKLLALGPFAWAIPSYKQAAQLQFEATSLVSQGASYHEAFQQLVTFYDQSNAIVAAQTGANTASASGWQATGQGYSQVAALRGRVVTSPLISSSTQQEVETLTKMANYDYEESAAVISGDLAAQSAIKGHLTQLSYALSALGATDTPAGFSDWGHSLSAQFDSLINSSR